VDNRTVEERFWAKVVKLDNGCWQWTGYCDPKGYGRIRVHGRIVVAHRFSYEHFAGVVPDGMQLDHLCLFKSCVRPDHLEVVTGLENMRRRYSAITECPYGHPYDEVITYVNPRGHRKCRTCLRKLRRDYEVRKGLRHSETSVAVI
jgi:hypothetical protein